MKRAELEACILWWLIFPMKCAEPQVDAADIAPFEASFVKLELLVEKKKAGSITCARGLTLRTFAANLL